MKRGGLPASAAAIFAAVAASTLPFQAAALGVIRGQQFRGDVPPPSGLAPPPAPSSNGAALSASAALLPPGAVAPPPLPEAPPTVVPPLPPPPFRSDLPDFAADVPALLPPLAEGGPPPMAGPPDLPILPGLAPAVMTPVAPLPPPPLFPPQPRAPILPPSAPQPAPPAASVGAGVAALDPAIDPAASQEGAPPKTGALLQQARARLRANHHSLANVSEELIAVQTQVADMEQSLFGKVLSFAAVKALYTDHEEVKNTNTKLRDDVARLTAQIEGLSAQLATAQRGYITGGQKQRRENEELRSEDIETGAKLQGLEFEASKDTPILEVHPHLVAEHEGLVNESVRVVHEGEAALAELLEVRRASLREKAKHAEMESQLRVLYNQSMNCHHRAEEERKFADSERLRFPKETAAVGVTLQHAVASAQAAEQRLAAEGAIIRAEIQRTETSAEHALSALQEAQINLKQLEQNIVDEVENITYRMNATLERTNVVDRSVEENKGMQTEDLKQKHAAIIKVSALQQQASPVKYATLRAENEAFENELKQAIWMLEKSRAGEAISISAAEQMSAEVEAQRVAADDAAAQVAEARTEGEKEYAKAVEEAKKQEEEAEKMKVQAEVALAATCSERWDKRKKEVEEEIEKCNLKKQELLVVQANRDALHGILQAQQTAQAVAAEPAGDAEGGATIAGAAES